MKMRKLFLLMLLCAALALCLAPSAFASDSGSCGENLTWTLDDEGALLIEGTGPMTSSPWLDSHRFDIKSVTIGEGVTSVKSEAFQVCIRMTSVSLPGTLEEIGESAFYNCLRLNTVNFSGSGLRSIDTNAFYGCRSLTGIAIPEGVESIGYYCFYNCVSLEEVSLPSTLTFLGVYSFYGATALQRIDVAEGNTVYASDDGVLFSADRTQLLQYPVGRPDTAYVIPEGVTEIAAPGFRQCAALTSVTIPEGVTSLGIRTFMGCTELTELSLPATLTDYGYQAFANCSKLTSVSVAEGSQSFCAVDDVLYNKSMTCLFLYPAGKSDAAFAVPESVTDIHEAFRYNSHLRSVSIPAAVRTLGDDPFIWCTGLQSITVAEDNETYRSADGVLFTKNGRELILYPAARPDESYAIPDGTVELRANSFNSTSNLRILTLPLSVTWIGWNVFRAEDALTEVHYAGSPQQRRSIQIGSDNERLENAHWTYGAESEPGLIGCGACGAQGDNVQWKLYDSGLLVIYGEGDMEDGTYFGDWFEDSELIERVEVGQGVTSLGSYFLLGLENLTEITLPEGLTRLSSGAVCYCPSLTTLTLPESLTEIGAYGISYCEALTQITIPAGVTTIGGGAFAGDIALTDITIAQGNESFCINDGMLCSADMTRLIACPVERSGSVCLIPEGVKFIDISSFCGCGALRIVTIPASVTSLGELAFEGCCGLERVVFEGSAPELVGDEYFFLPPFFEIEALAIYPAGDESWTEEYRLACGESLQWAVAAEAPVQDGLGFDGEAWHHYKNGRIDYGFTGLAYREDVGWWYVENGTIDFGYTGLAYGENVGWWYVEDGTIDFDFTGMGFREGVGWWYCENGAISFTFTGLYQDVNLGWVYVVGGALQGEYTGLVFDPALGWWYVEEGFVNFFYTGLAYTEGVGWWYVEDGTIDFDYCGLAYREDIGCWYVENGAISFGFTGLYQDDWLGWVYVAGGALQSGYTGLVYDPAVGWWYVEEGFVNFFYTGLAYREDIGWWYVENGTISFAFNGVIEEGGQSWSIVNSQAVQIA